MCTPRRAGSSGVAQAQCESLGCCWRPSAVPGLPHCFHENGVGRAYHVMSTRVDGGSGGVDATLSLRTPAHGGGGGGDGGDGHRGQGSGSDGSVESSAFAELSLQVWGGVERCGEVWGRKRGRVWAKRGREASATQPVGPEGVAGGQGMKAGVKKWAACSRIMVSRHGSTRRQECKGAASSWIMVARHGVQGGGGDANRAKGMPARQGGQSLQN
eukprot:356307-Chlamydomonas_euryale.AAC.2